MAKPLFLGIDAGGSQTRAALVSVDGKIFGCGTSGPANHLTGDRKMASASLREAVKVAIQNHPMRNGVLAVQGIGIGSAALVSRGRSEEARELLDGIVVSETIILDTDAYTAWAGAFGCQPGIVVIAGTGSICLGVSDTDQRARVGGWGWRFGDEGSAYHIAAQGIRLALQMADRRLPERRLWHALQRFLGLDPQVETLSSDVTEQFVEAWLYDSERTPADIAAFAPFVAVAASEGSLSAHALLINAGSELTRMVSAAAAQLPLAPPIRVAYQGGVLTGNKLVRDALITGLRDLAVPSEVGEPLHAAEFGAALLAIQACGYPIPVSFHASGLEKSKNMSSQHRGGG